MNFDGWAVAFQPESLYGGIMPKGPQGQKRPADAIGLAVLIGKIATGEIDEAPTQPQKGKVGGKARADSLDPARRKAIAVAAAKKRWAKSST